MDYQKIDSITSQINELAQDELNEVYRWLRKKRRALRQQNNEEKAMEEQQQIELLQSGELREIMLIIHGRQFFHEEGKPSSYEYIVIDKETGKVRRRASDKIPNETGNRALILGLINGLENLSQDRKCHISIFTKGAWGFAKMTRKNKGVNGDLLGQLEEAISQRGDIVEAFEDPTVVEDYLYNR